MAEITLKVSDVDLAEAHSICEAMEQTFDEWLAEAFQDALSRQKIRKRNIDAVVESDQYMPTEGGGSKLRPRPAKEIVR